MECVKIGGVEYKVITVEDIKGEDGEPLFGQIDFAACTIKLDLELCPQARRQALWHEILHGILTQAGHHDELKDELIDALAYGIMGVLHTSRPNCSRDASRNSASNLCLLGLTGMAWRS